MVFKKLNLAFCFLLISMLCAVAQAENPAPLITLDVKDADVRDVMRMFSQASGLNIVISDDVSAKITLSVTDVNWEDALNMILRTNNLTSVKEGAFLRIMTFERFRQEQEGVPLVNQTICLNFAKADDIVRVLDPIRSNRGRISAHTQTNTVVVTETPDNFKEMMKIVEKLDKRTPQVMIEALMLDVKLTDEEQLGIDWKITHKEVPARSIEQNLLSSHDEGVIRYGKTILPVANFDATINFWAQNKKAEILANPKVLTLDGLTASIELTDEIPYTSSVVDSTIGVTTTASFRQAGIKLNVTPHISSEGFISLNLKTEQSFQSGTITTKGAASSDQPIIDSRKAETNLLVKDGETIVIGGLRKKDTTHTKDKIPWLGDIPVLKYLFQRNVNKVIDTELLIFVTPIIVTESVLKPAEQKNLEKFKRLKSESAQLKSLDKAKPFSLRPAQ